MAKPEKREAKSAPAPEEKKEPRGRSARAGVTFPVSRVGRHLKESGASRISGTAPVYLAASLEYIVTELAEAAAAKTMARKKSRITVEDVANGIRSDPELNRLVGGLAFFTGDKLEEITKAVTLQQTDDLEAPDAA
jgi:histone H2A